MSWIRADVQRDVTANPLVVAIQYSVSLGPGSHWFVEPVPVTSLACLTAYQASTNAYLAHGYFSMLVKEQIGGSALQSLEHVSREIE